EKYIVSLRPQLITGVGNPTNINHYARKNQIAKTRKKRKTILLDRRRGRTRQKGRKIFGKIGNLQPQHQPGNRCFELGQRRKMATKRSAAHRNRTKHPYLQRSNVEKPLGGWSSKRRFDRRTSRRKIQGLVGRKRSKNQREKRRCFQ